MQTVARHPVIEDTLDAWDIGDARAAYGGHAYRVFNFARQILGSENHDDELAVASAFHDIGIWTDGTFDYLPPSIAHARDFVREKMPQLSSDRVADIIANHHVLRRIHSGTNAEVIEAFRLADRVDVSRGWLGAGVNRVFRRDVVAAFPYAGFHGILVRTALRWFFRHPLRPLPMLRLSRVSKPVL